jgi:hypothetical protein
MSYKEEYYNEDVGIEQIKKSKDNLNVFLDNSEKYECKISCYVNGKKKNIKCYQSRGRIRHAVTGILYDDYVGSSKEDLYFKTIVPSIGGPFFYNSPEEYERHMFSTLDVVTKNKWSEKNTRARKRAAL